MLESAARFARDAEVTIMRGDDERSSVQALRNLQITTPTGASVPLRELAQFQYDLDEGYVWRRGRLPTITVQAEPLPGLQPASAHERIAGAMVNANFFQVLDASPAIGRALQPSDELPGAARVAVISHRFWRERFSGNPAILGQAIRVNSELHTIVGVMPPDIDYPSKALIWIPPHWRVPDDPLRPTDDPTGQRTHGYFSVLGRLKPGVSFDAAVADMDAVALSLERDYPNDNQALGSFVTRLRDDLVADVRATTLLLFAAVGLR
jgi:hypothetical protein